MYPQIITLCHIGMLNAYTTSNGLKNPNEKSLQEFLLAQSKAAISPKMCVA